DWAPFKNLCGHMQELFQAVYDIGVGLVDREAVEEDRQELERLWQVFLASEGISPPDLDELPAYANSTRSVLRRHADKALAMMQEVVGGSGSSAQPLAAEKLLSLAAELARRLQLLIENVSVTLLLNYHLANLEHNGRVDQKNYVHQIYGDVDSVSVVFHEIPGKRWDSLTHLLQQLGVSENSVAMVEVGVEAANTSQRLLERNPLLSYIGVDPYMGNDGLYEDVVRRLQPFRDSGRFTLHRSISLSASDLVADGSMDLVFLDARHDYEAVSDDIQAWRPKVRPGGILSGHDFSWMFPTVAMAVYKSTFDAP
ncbi:unnamed protein product, partial [Polarella glacialis]